MANGADYRFDKCAALAVLHYTGMVLKGYYGVYAWR